MKNQLIVLSLVGIAAFFQACVTIQVSPSSELAKRQFASDDLYDTPQRAVASTKKVRSDYLNFDDNTVVIEEEEGIAQQSTYLNSRSVYNYNNSVNPNTYNRAYSNGYVDGFSSASTWNNWYVNPFITFGYGFGSRWYSPLSSYNLMMNPFYSAYGMMYDPFYYGSSFGFGSVYGFNSYRYYDPFYNPWSFYNPYRNFGGVVYNNYNYYNSLGSNGYNYNNTTVDPPRKVYYGPRETGTSNRAAYGDSFSNTPRSGNNYYNNQGSNQPSNYSNRSVGTQSYERSAAPRRNSNVEYRYAEPSSSRQYESFSRPSYNSGGGGGSYGGGGSSGGGGGGSSRGPR
ncbi:hypothetical protein [Aquirufa rosea]|uniref:Uncharacterized protein n=1 Tax=Aquirufa rosea TaxID=2509241 RepID=A0A4Q1BXM2_9BACT|nr:hypothetical protein [Aquirufa rosea]RXK47115.1 hypothetical protein ESB04_10975 [Aquirufa rosea]